MTFERAKLIPICEGVTLIDNAGESTCYLICGRERALLVDTANGREDLAAIVRSLTDLPVTVVCTHGHPDHILGNKYFAEAYLPEADLELVKDFREPEDKSTRLPLRAGEIFDLGGVILETVDMHGHTPGSLGLLDRTHRLLFSGDAVNPHLWMQLDHGLPISALRDMIVALKRDFGGDFDHILHGHATATMRVSWLDDLLRGCDELLSGKGENDPDYKWFGGVCKFHPLTNVPGEGIVYTEDKVK